jgi:hypothetical protein
MPVFCEKPMQKLLFQGWTVLTAVLMLCGAVVVVAPAALASTDVPAGYYLVPMTPGSYGIQPIQQQYQQPYYYYQTGTTQWPSVQPQVQIQDESQYLQYLMALVTQLQAQLAYYQQGGGGYNYNFDDDDRDDGDSEVEVTTEGTSDVDDDSARLRGEIDFNSSDYAYVWFEWGEDDDDLDEETSRVRVDDDDDEDFSARITRLDEDERYYYRAVAEDEDDDKDYGRVRNFRTDDHGGNDDEPDVRDLDADDITDDSVELSGEVDMNDFNNGVVFFVYGEDEDQVEDVEDDYDSYSDVDEDGDDLQKVRVDTDLDGEEDYRRDIGGLDDNTDYFYTLCVEFEDEDDDDTLICASVEDFETDN